MVALGADLDPAATPGLVEGGHEFYTVAGSLRAARRAARASSAGRRSSALTGKSFKCPPAPSETALLLHDYLSARGRRDGDGHLGGDAVRHADSAVTRHARARSSLRSRSAASRS